MYVWTGGGAVSEIVVTFTEEEARALVPWKGADHTVAEWNHRLDSAEDAVAKIPQPKVAA